MPNPVTLFLLVSQNCPSVLDHCLHPPFLLFSTVLPTNTGPLLAFSSSPLATSQHCPPMLDPCRPHSLRDHTLLGSNLETVRPVELIPSLTLTSRPPSLGPSNVALVPLSLNPLILTTLTYPRNYPYYLQVSSLFSNLLLLPLSFTAYLAHLGSASLLIPLHIHTRPLDASAKPTELGLSRTTASTEVSIRNVCLSLPGLLIPFLTSLARSLLLNPLH